MEVNQKQRDCEVVDLKQQLHNMGAEKDRLDAKIKQVRNNLLRIGFVSIGYLDQLLKPIIFK